MSHPQPAVLSAVEDQEEWQPHAAEDFQHIGTVGKIAIGLLGASTVTHLLSTWSDWNTYSVVHRYLGGMPNVDDADLNRADAIAKVTAVPNVIVSVAAAVVFVIWLWRARVNSEVFCQADHRRGHGWVLASWFVPGPNLWYPKQIVDDVWLASDPKTPVYADDLRRFRTPSLTSVWWVAWIGALAFDVVVRRFLMWMEATVGSLRGIALAGTASLVLTAISAVAATMVIRKINHMQTSRKWIPWWDQGPKLSAVPSYDAGPVPSYANDDTDEQPAIQEPIAAAPALGLVRQPEMQFAGGPSPYQAPPAPQTPAPNSFPGDGVAAPAAFGGNNGNSNGDDEQAQWSPFASVAQSWKDEDEDTGLATEQFSPVQSWQNEKPAEPTYEAPRSSWNDYLGSRNDDALSTTSVNRWMDETPPLTVVQPDPYPSYQPEPQRQPEPQQPSWAAQYSPSQYSPSQYESYSYDDYRTSTSSPAEAQPAPQPAPEPEPAPVARAGRRAARVAVDSPSAIQPAVQDHTGRSTRAARSSESEHQVYSPSEHSQPSASSGYYEPAPARPEPQDDFLTPSKPLPPVPSYGPEPSSYSGGSGDYGYSNNSYGEHQQQSSYQPDYSPSYNNSEYNYEQPTNYGYSSDYSNQSNGYGYDSYENNGSQQYGNESYDTSYSPNYASESYGTQYEQEQQQSQYDYEQSAPEEPTTPRTHPRRRWT